MTEKLINTEQLAKALGVNKMTIYRELQRKDCSIPYSRIGRNNYFTLSEVLLAIKITPVDKEEIVEKLKSLLEDDCPYGEKQNCFHEELKDIISFIEETNKKKEK